MTDTQTTAVAAVAVPLALAVGYGLVRSFKGGFSVVSRVNPSGPVPPILLLFAGVLAGSFGAVNWWAGVGTTNPNQIVRMAGGGDKLTPELVALYKNEDAHVSRNQMVPLWAAIPMTALGIAMGLVGLITAANLPISAPWLLPADKNTQATK